MEKLITSDVIAERLSNLDVFPLLKYDCWYCVQYLNGKEEWSYYTDPLRRFSVVLFDSFKEAKEYFYEVSKGYMGASLRLVKVQTPSFEGKQEDLRGEIT